jgi:hypothetical protein
MPRWTRVRYAATTLATNQYPILSFRRVVRPIRRVRVGCGCGCAPGRRVGEQDKSARASAPVGYAERATRGLRESCVTWLGPVRTSLAELATRDLVKGLEINSLQTDSALRTSGSWVRILPGAPDLTDLGHQTEVLFCFSELGFGIGKTSVHSSDRDARPDVLVESAAAHSVRDARPLPSRVARPCPRDRACRVRPAVAGVSPRRRRGPRTTASNRSPSRPTSWGTEP